jgi:hypothetical protein
MKKYVFLLIFLSSMMVEGIAQDKLKIGEFYKGKLKITNESVLRSFFMANIGKSGTLDREVKVNVSPTADRAFVYVRVTDNKSGITSIGVLLVNIDHIAYIVTTDPNSPVMGPGGGGSATVTCTGNPCNQCMPNLQWNSGSWLPHVTCECMSPDGKCNQTVSVSFGINVGL